MRKTNIKEGIQKVVNEIREMENLKHPLFQRNRETWMFERFAKKTKKVELQNELRRQQHSTKIKLLKAASEKRREIKRWGQVSRNQHGLIVQHYQSCQFP